MLVPYQPLATVSALLPGHASSRWQAIQRGASCMGRLRSLPQGQRLGPQPVPTARSLSPTSGTRPYLKRARPPQRGPEAPCLPPRQHPEVHRIRHLEQRWRRFGSIAILGNHSLDALIVRTLSRYDFSRAHACVRRVDTQAHPIVGACGASLKLIPGLTSCGAARRGRLAVLVQEVHRQDPVLLAFIPQNPGGPFTTPPPREASLATPKVPKPPRRSRGGT